MYGFNAVSFAVCLSLHLPPIPFDSIDSTSKNLIEEQANHNTKHRTERKKNTHTRQTQMIRGCCFVRHLIAIAVAGCMAL